MIYASNFFLHETSLRLPDFLRTLHKNLDAFQLYKPHVILYKNNGLIAAERKSDAHKLTSKWLKEDLHRKLLW